MLKKFLMIAVAVAGVSASACWFTASNYARCYIALINTAATFYTNPVPDWTGSNIPCPPAGTQSLPCQVWIKLQPRSEEGAAAITTAVLQYKKLPSGVWTTFKTLTALTWTVDFSKPMELFGPNIFDPPGAAAGNEYLIRLYFTDGIYENADLGVDAPEGGDTVWRNQWVTKIIIGAHRRPGL